MSKVTSAFTYRIYKIAEEEIVDIDHTQLLPERILTKMGKNEFRCYLKEIRKRRVGLNPEDVKIIKKIDKRIRNKETVRKSKQRFRADFDALKKEYEETFQKYREEIEKARKLIECMEECDCHGMCEDIKQVKEIVEDKTCKFINFEL